MRQNVNRSMRLRLDFQEKWSREMRLVDTNNGKIKTNLINQLKKIITIYLTNTKKIIPNNLVNYLNIEKKIIHEEKFYRFIYYL